MLKFVLENYSQIYEDVLTQHSHSCIKHKVAYSNKKKKEFICIFHLLKIYASETLCGNECCIIISIFF